MVDRFDEERPRFHNRIAGAVGLAAIFAGSLIVSDRAAVPTQSKNTPDVAFANSSEARSSPPPTPTPLVHMAVELGSKHGDALGECDEIERNPKIDWGDYSAFCERERAIGRARFGTPTPTPHH